MGMTLTLTVGQWVGLVAFAVTVGFISGAVCVARLLRPELVPPLRVELARPSEPGELSAFPGWDVITHNELDDFARRYSGLIQ